MKNFESLFTTIYDSTRTKSSKYELVKSLDSSITASNESFETLPKGPQEEFSLQTQIRPLFGKSGVNDSPIGTHPDFIKLEGTDTRTEQHYVCTLFVDIKGSTRLSLLYPLEMVYLFKNSVIKTCVEVVRSLDGHVHRIMGDAVMAFFGGNNIEKENAIADALNCSITLRAVLEESIKPWMERNGLDSKDFGFRIGCDFGDDKEVLWGSFGYHNVGEVSATGLPVDMASKLQSLASKNQTMLGQGVLEYINWPEKYSKVKKKEKNGDSISLPVVTPNLTDANGTPLNYKMRLLEYENCIDYIALPRSFRASINGSKVIDNPEISYKCYAIDSDISTEYISASKFLNPGIDLKFRLVANTKGRLNFPLRVEFSKTNHGKDTPESERDIEQSPEVQTLKKEKMGQYNKTPKPVSEAVRTEYTSYRGLHTMKCQVLDGTGKIIFRDWIGVMIK